MGEKTLNTEEQIVFHPDLLVIPESGEAPYLTAYRCEECGKMWFPKLPYCPNCWSDKLAKTPLSRRGKLYSYTVTRVSGPDMKVPYVVGYVDFPEKVRVFAQIDAEPEQVKPDMEVEVSTGIIRENLNGKRVLSYKFKPVG